MERRMKKRKTKNSIPVTIWSRKNNLSLNDSELISVIRECLKTILPTVLINIICHTYIISCVQMKLLWNLEESSLDLTKKTSALISNNKLYINIRKGANDVKKSNHIITHIVNIHDETIYQLLQMTGSNSIHTTCLVQSQNNDDDVFIHNKNSDSPYSGISTLDNELPAVLHHSDIIHEFESVLCVGNSNNYIFVVGQKKITKHDLCRFNKSCVLCLRNTQYIPKMINLSIHDGNIVKVVEYKYNLLIITDTKLMSYDSQNMLKHYDKNHSYEIINACTNQKYLFILRRLNKREITLDTYVLNDLYTNMLELEKARHDSIKIMSSDKYKAIPKSITDISNKKRKFSDTTGTNSNHTYNIFCANDNYLALSIDNTISLYQIV